MLKSKWKYVGFHKFNMWQNLQSFLALSVVLFHSVQGCNGPRVPETYCHWQKLLKRHKNAFRTLKIKKPTHPSIYALDFIIVLKGINSFINLLYSKQQCAASPDHTVGIESPNFIPGRGFELRFGGLLGLWLFTQGCAVSSHIEASNQGLFSQILVLDGYDSRLTQQASCLCWCCKTICMWFDDAVCPLLTAKEWGWRETPHLHIARERLAFREAQKQPFLDVLTSGRKQKAQNQKLCLICTVPEKTHKLDSQPHEMGSVKRSTGNKAFDRRKGEIRWEGTLIEKFPALIRAEKESKHVFEATPVLGAYCCKPL